MRRFKFEAIVAECRIMSQMTKASHTLKTLGLINIIGKTASYPELTRCPRGDAHTQVSHVNGAPQLGSPFGRSEIRR